MYKIILILMNRKMKYNREKRRERRDREKGI